MSDNPQEYLNAILEEIDAAKGAGRNGVFKIREKMTDYVGNYVRDYLIANTPYRIDMRKCPQCTFEWDVIIIF